MLRVILARAKSRLDVRVQADGDRLAVHQNVSHGIAAGAGDDQGFAEAEWVGFSRSISIISLLPLISTVMGMGESFSCIWILIQSLLPIPRSQRMSHRLHLADQPPGNSADFIQVTVRAPHSGQGW